MNEITNLFIKHKYAYVPNFLDITNCAEYVEQFNKAIEKGEATKDSQCPLSFSWGHCPLFDSLLEQVHPQIEVLSGKKLYPTYAYGRKYAPGDELKIHKDRPSCEISVTLTLGISGDAWPIYMGYNSDKTNSSRIEMKVGDAVIYRGQDVFHWREKYTEGEWQVQVFLHYVDAEGPNAEWKYDKRDKLAHHGKFEKGNEDYILIEKAFSEQSCEKLVQQFDSENNLVIDAALGNNNYIDKTIRDTKKIILNSYIGIGATLAGIGLNQNNRKWKYNITHSVQTEYLRYDKNGHFSPHIDTFINNYNDPHTRKLTIILFLNKEYEGGKLYFQTGEKKEYPKINVGDVIIFPSFLVHGVEPVISGIRRSIVTWMNGPYFK